MWKEHTNKLLFFVFIAAIGVVVLSVPQMIASQHKLIREEFGPTWGSVYLVIVVFGILLLSSITIWVFWNLYISSWLKGLRREKRSKNPSALSMDEQAAELEENLTYVHSLQNDPKVEAELRAKLAPLVKALEEKQTHQTVEIVAFGTVSSGKSSLLNALLGEEYFQHDVRGGTTVLRNEIVWNEREKIILVDTPGIAEALDEVHQIASIEAAKRADFLLLVVDGPLREYESELLKTLAQMEKEILLCLNKSDWYSPAEQQKLLDQIGRQTNEFLPRANILAVQSGNVKRLRTTEHPDGTTSEEFVEEPPNIAELADRLLVLTTTDKEKSLMANLLLQSRGLVEEAKQEVQKSLDNQAKKLVERYMFSAGSMAALSPWPLVDLAAGCTINTKMVFELAQIYRQKIDLETATSLLGQLGKNLVSVLGVSAATPVVTSLVASLVKSVPGIGTLTGGFMQAVVQAVITRWIGLVFIEYFKYEMHLTEKSFSDIAREKWQEITTPKAILSLYRQTKSYVASSEKNNS
ncbi:MAG: GTP-binding protein [Pirellulaceae bacterium]|nr:GTP-binding protein [Pirellulaceae bacterium]